MGSLFLVGLAGYVVWNLLNKTAPSSYTVVRDGLRFWEDQTEAAILDALSRMSIRPTQAALPPDAPAGSVAMFELVPGTPSGVNARTAVVNAAAQGKFIATTGTLAAHIDGLSADKQFLAIATPAAAPTLVGLDRFFVGLTP